MIPEELPLVFTMTLVLGVRRMTEQNVIVREMAAIEQLGRVTDICSDKTGTITQASMVIVRAWSAQKEYLVTGQGVVPEGRIIPLEVGFAFASRKNMSRVVTKPSSANLLQHVDTFPILRLMAEISLRCNSSTLYWDETDSEWHASGQPTDIAFMVFARKVLLQLDVEMPIQKTLREFPFDSSRKMMSVIVGDDQDGSVSIFTKGSAEGIVAPAPAALTPLGVM